MSRVLVVDDDKDVVDLVRFLLEKDGHEVFEANDGLQGIAAAEQEHPDLIILDVMMPEKDGYAVSKHLLTQPTTQEIPIIILTAKGHMREVFEPTANVRGYMEKPFDSKAFRQTVLDILSRKNPQD